MNLTNKISKTLTLIEEQIGLRLYLCDYFTGVRFMGDRQYFNIVLRNNVSESVEYTQLVRFSDRFKTITVEPNGLKRVAIFFN